MNVALNRLSVAWWPQWLRVWIDGSSLCHAQSDNEETRAGDAHSEPRVFRQACYAPFIKKYCLECHQNKRPHAGWAQLLSGSEGPRPCRISGEMGESSRRVKAHDMPPDEWEQPSEEEREMFQQWLGKLKYLSVKDPGQFIIRRLTKAEYGRTLHDLFDVDPSIADALPDEVSGEGYLNSLSPLQLEQYLAITDAVLNQALSKEDDRPTQLQRQLFGDAPASPDDQPAAATSVAQTLAKKNLSKAWNA